MGASNAELSVVGDFDAEEIGRLAGELFGAWKSPGSFEKVTDPYRKIEPVNRSIETPDKQNAMFVAGLRLDLSNTDADYPALVLANYMLGGGFLNSRLATRIRQKEGLSYGISSSLSAASKVNDGSFLVNAIAAPQNVAKVEAAGERGVGQGGEGRIHRGGSRRGEIRLAAVAKRRAVGGRGPWPPHWRPTIRRNHDDV